MQRVLFPHNISNAKGESLNIKIYFIVGVTVFMNDVRFSVIL
jgi:hypothetical protein